MHCSRGAGLTLINASMSGSAATTLRVVGSRVVGVGTLPRLDDRVIDLQGDRLLPGLINAHDHLQLNSLPHFEVRKKYTHVRDWITEVDWLRRTDRGFRSSVAVPRNQRLLLGGVKNLLSGVTTVAHHDPLYPFLSSASYPTRVVKDVGWSHSLYIDGAATVRGSYQSTPHEYPWIIHAAEGLDTEARSEFDRLDALGCVGANTLIVHGLALDHEQRLRLQRAGAGLIWCPSSNLRLFGKSAVVGQLAAAGRVALGTDSRLSGARDLLEELRIAAEVSGLDAPTLESLVTAAAARLLRLPDRGVLRVGARADLVILPAGMPLGQATRADIRLVMLDGTARLADEHYAHFTPPQPNLRRLAGASSQWVRVRIDGRPKLMESTTAALLRDATLQEAGLEFARAFWRRASALRTSASRACVTIRGR
jgi:cytosine/adenosine deaminase-related metal-dependent hydrolase